MNIFLGNLSVSQIETRMGISLTEDERNTLNSMRQEKADDIESGKWHCFDLPFMLICGDKPTADEVAKIFLAHDLSHVKEALQLSWER